MQFATQGDTRIFLNTPSNGGRPGGRLNLEMSPYKHRNSHYKDKTAVRPPYLYNGNLIFGKTVFILRRGPRFIAVHPIVAPRNSGLASVDFSA